MYVYTCIYVHIHVYALIRDCVVLIWGLCMLHLGPIGTSMVKSTVALTLVSDLSSARVHSFVGFQTRLSSLVGGCRISMALASVIHVRYTDKDKP